jgi:hypothetical protein
MNGSVEKALRAAAPCDLPMQVRRRAHSVESCAQGDITVPLAPVCVATEALFYPNAAHVKVNDDDPLARFDRRMGFEDVERTLREEMEKLDKIIANKQVVLPVTMHFNVTGTH